MGDNPAAKRRERGLPSWDIPICGSATAPSFRRTGGVNPSLTITSIAMRTADRIQALPLVGSCDPMMATSR